MCVCVHVYIYIVYIIDDLECIHHPFIVEHPPAMKGLKKTYVYPHCSCKFDCQNITPLELVDAHL